VKFTIYDTESGRIEAVLDIGIDPETGAVSTDLDANMNDEQAAIWGEFSAASHYVAAGSPIPFPVKPGDWAAWDWSSKSWTDPRDAAWYASESERLLALLREERDARLTACDWSQLPDAPLSAEGLAAWRAYRQALRDLPENTADPASPVWPTPPTA